MRRCTKCHQVKALGEFYAHPQSALGRDTKCKECVKAAEFGRRHNPDRKEVVLERDRLRNKNPKRMARRNELRRKRRKIEPTLTITAAAHRMLKRALDAAGMGKNGKSYGLLGYKPRDLVLRIECQFQPGMGWHNRGEWHIDHKKPISAFIRQGVTDPRIMNALSNLRPMWAKENLVKGAKWPLAANDNAPAIAAKDAA